MNLHGRVSDGLDLRSRGMLSEIKLFSISHGFDRERVYVYLRDIHSPRDEKRLSGKDEEKFIEKVEEETLQVLTGSLNAKRTSISLV